MDAREPPRSDRRDMGAIANNARIWRVGLFPPLAMPPRGVTKTVDLNERDEVVVDVVTARIGIYGWRKHAGSCGG